MRVRFAPSPTGALHVGGARTALFNWLLAQRSGGAFLLRIEDTDRERSLPEHVDAIVDALAWLGLAWDEEPVRQADGADRHRALARRLLNDGLAYRDFTPPEEYAREREAAVKAGTGAVTRLARTLAERWSPEDAGRLAEEGRPFAVRFRVPDGETAWDDLVHGAVRFDNEEIEDFVVLRSDGTPTYNLAVVSDDAAMRISHVVRGSDHLSNTPKQIMLYRAAGEPVPEFGHLPLILGPDGSRLSKRHGAQSVQSYRREGVLAGALVNFLALLGWSPGTDEEALPKQALVSAFGLDRVLKKGAVFDPEKLRWLNRRYMTGMSPEKLAEKLAPVLEAEIEDEREAAATSRRRDGRLAAVAGGPPGGWSTPSGLPPPGALAPQAPVLGPDTGSAPLSRLAELLAPRTSSLREMAVAARPYVGPVTDFEPKAARQAWGRDPEAAARILSGAREVLAGAEWDARVLETALRAFAQSAGAGAGEVFRALRVALTGTGASPGIFDVLMMVGRRPSLARIDVALKAVGAAGEAPQAPARSG